MQLLHEAGRSNIALGRVWDLNLDRHVGGASVGQGVARRRLHLDRLVTLIRSFYELRSVIQGNLDIARLAMFQIKAYWS